MAKWNNPYQVFKTPCWPNEWKVGRFEEDDNATCNYFADRAKAASEALRRNQARAKEQLNGGYNSDRASAG